MENFDSLSNPYFPQNTLRLSFPYEYASSVVTLNWYDVSMAIQNGFLSLDDAVEHAIVQLETIQEPPEQVISLSLLALETVFPHSIHPYIDELAEWVSEDEKQHTMRKLLYLVLNWVYNHRSEYDDPLGMVETIYDDFGFPERISSFVRYLPMSGPKLESKEAYIERLFQSWQTYLEAERRNFSDLPEEA